MTLSENSLCLFANPYVLARYSAGAFAKFLIAIQSEKSDFSFKTAANENETAGILNSLLTGEKSIFIDSFVLHSSFPDDFSNKYFRKDTIQNDLELNLAPNVSEKEKLLRSHIEANAAFIYSLAYIREGVSEEDISVETEHYLRCKGSQSGLTSVRVSFNGFKKSYNSKDSLLTKPAEISIHCSVSIGGFHSEVLRRICYGSADVKHKAEYLTAVQLLDKAENILSEIKSTAKIAEGILSIRNSLLKAGFILSAWHADAQLNLPAGNFVAVHLQAASDVNVPCVSRTLKWEHGRCSRIDEAGYDYLVF